MAQQSVKQAARRAAREVTARRRAERVAREQRIEDLAVAVLTALGQREAAERRAGEALVELTDMEGLSLKEAVDYCDAQISTREATRMRLAARPSCEQAKKQAAGDPGQRDGAAERCSDGVQPGDEEEDRVPGR